MTLIISSNPLGYAPSSTYIDQSILITMVLLKNVSPSDLTRTVSSLGLKFYEGIFSFSTQSAMSITSLSMMFALCM